MSTVKAGEAAQELRRTLDPENGPHARYGWREEAQPHEQFGLLIDVLGLGFLAVAEAVHSLHIKDFQYDEVRE